MSSDLIYHKNKNINIFLYIAISFFILSLVSGPFVPDLIVVIVSFFFIFYYFKNYHGLIIINNFVKILIVFYIYIIFNSFLSTEKFLSLKSSIPFIRFIIFAIAISFLIENKKFKYLIYYSFLFLYVSLFFDSVIQIYFKKNILGFPLFNDRVSSFFGDELILGSFISKTLAILLFLLFNLKLDRKFFHYLCILSISIFLVIASAERTSLLVLFIVVFFSLFYLKFSQFISVLIVLLVSIFVSFTGNNNAYDRLINHTLNQIVVDGKFNYPSYRHQLHYLSAFEIFKDHKIFGSGLKTFRVFCSQNPYSLKDKIERDNIVISKINGIYMKDKDDNWIALIPDKKLKNTLFQTHIVKLSSNLDNYYSGLRSYGKQNPTYQINQGNLLKPYVNDYEKIKIGQPIFSFYEFNNGCNTHPHNFYIQFLSELGIIGLLFLICTYIYIIYISLKKLLIKLKTNKLSSDFILYINYLAVLFPFIPSGNFFNNYLCLLIFLPLCMFKLCYIK
jgi:O-antigen ligase